MDDGSSATTHEIRAWLLVGPWGRCVYRGDNEAVDHQVVSMGFAGDIAATFTMTAFDERRDPVICGTRETRADGRAVKTHCGQDILIEEHSGTAASCKIPTSIGGHEGHGGADEGPVGELDFKMEKPMADMRAGCLPPWKATLLPSPPKNPAHTGRQSVLRA